MTEEQTEKKLDIKDWLKKVRARKQASNSRVTTEDILRALDADRK